MAYSHTNSKGTTYILHSKDVTLRGEEIKLFITFLKAEGANACDLPSGKKVIENDRTGLPFLKKA